MAGAHEDRVADGRYELVRRIGRGSSGEVWLANDTRLDREVAIKRAPIPAHLSEAERQGVRKRLEREARAAARLGRPGVVPLFDVQVTEDTVDLVMAYVDAPNLQQHVQEHGPMADEEAARVAMVVLDVLEDAHEQGVIHRDIKPSNVLVAEGVVRLTDFGIAALTDDTDLTRTGVTLGSPSYMPPEQAQGSEAAPAADFWGLGATLYYAISGQPPFKRDRAIATMHAVVNDPHTPLPHDHPLGPLIDRLLQKDPAARPPAEDIREALREVAGGASATDETQVITTAGATMADPDGDTRRDADALAAAVPVREQQAPGASAAGSEQAGARRAPPTRPGPRPVGPPAAPTERSPTAGEEPSRRRWPLAAGLAVLAAAGALVLADLGGTDRGDDRMALPSATEGGAGTEADATAPADAGAGDPLGGSGSDGEASGAVPGPTPEATEPTSTSPSASDATSGGSTSATVPEGWELHEGPTWTVATPQGWDRRADTGNRIDLVDPSTGAYLRVDWTDSPEADPAADWEEKSDAFAQRYGGYEELGIEEVDYRDHPAALWEYAYDTGGRRFHAYNLGFVAAGNGYALNFQAPADRWGDLEPLFEGFTSSFQPR